MVLRAILFGVVIYVVMFSLFFMRPKWWKGSSETWRQLSETRKGRAALKEMLAANPGPDMTEEEMLFGLRFAAAMCWPRVLWSGTSNRMRLRIRAAHVAELRRKRRERNEAE